MRKNGVRDGLNLLFPTPIAKVSWKRSAEFGELIKDHFDLLDIKSPQGNKGKQESTFSPSTIEHTLNKEFFEFVIENALLMAESLLGTDLNSAYVSQQFAEALGYSGDVVKSELSSEVEQSRIILGVSNSWMNIYGPGEFHGPHCHAGAFLSAVYMVQPIRKKTSPLDGALAFVDPRASAVSAPRPSLVAEGMDSVVKLDRGELIIFPGWLNHYVFPHRSNDTRVTISANLAVSKIREFG